MKTIAVLSCSLMLIASGALAAEETGAIYGPKCDTAKVKELLGDKAIKVEAGAAEGIHNVTYDSANKEEVTMTIAKNCI